MNKIKLEKIAYSLAEMERLLNRTHSGNLGHMKANIINGIRYNREVVSVMINAETKVYISGAVTGHKRELVLNKFTRAANMLCKAGYEVVNPVLLVTEDVTWEMAMKTCISELVKCSHIYLLNDWHQSEGARLEYLIAQQLGIKTLSEEEIKCQIEEK